MSRASVRARVAGCAVALAVLAAGCSDDDGGSEEARTTTTVKYDAAAKVASPAVDLRTNMTTLFAEHVLLAGIGSSFVVAGQDPAPALAALEENNVALADEIAEHYDDQTGQQFLDLWRRNGAALMEFAAGSAATDQARIDKGKADMKAAQDEIATLLNTVNIQLTTDALGEQFESYSTTVQQAVTAMAKKDPKAVGKLKEAADGTTDLAIVIVAAFVKDKGKDLPGDIDALSAAIRTELASKLQEHVYLAGVATGTGLSGGDLEAAADPLDENTLELGRAIGTVYGDEAQQDFLELWRQHIEFFVDFTEGAGAGDRARMDKARQDLDGYRRAFGEFLNSVNPNLAAEDVATDLGEHVDSLLVAIEAQAAKDPLQVVKLRSAAGHMPETALFLATGIARQFPTKFG